MDRRTFMKLMGGLASMPIIGRIAKPLKSETVQEGIAAVSDKGMELYEMVISKVMKEGKKIGIFNTWKECNESIYKFKNALFMFILFKESK